MSKVNPFVKISFSNYCRSVTSPEETSNLVQRFIQALPPSDHGYDISLVGRIGCGKTQIANTIARTLKKNKFTSTVRSKLIGRNEHAWRIWCDSRSGLMIRNIDMAAIDAFQDAVIPSLQKRTYDLIEHATDSQQEKSMAIISISKETENTDDRIISFYINPALKHAKSLKF